MQKEQNCFSLNDNFRLFSDDITYDGNLIFGKYISDRDNINAIRSLVQFTYDIVVVVVVTVYLLHSQTSGFHVAQKCTVGDGGSLFCN